LGKEGRLEFRKRLRNIPPAVAGRVAALEGANMYAIMVEVRVIPNREEEARRMLRDMIVSRAKAHVGISAG
jgi:hypothetical protein